MNEALGCAYSFIFIYEFGSFVLLYRRDDIFPFNMNTDPLVKRIRKLLDYMILELCLSGLISFRFYYKLTFFLGIYLHFKFTIWFINNMPFDRIYMRVARENSSLHLWPITKYIRLRSVWMRNTNVCHQWMNKKQKNRWTVFLCSC